MSISQSEKIKVTLQGHIACLTIDNPAANTWDTDSLPALKDIVETLNAQPEIYALVLTGAGEKFFSAGADLKLFADGDPATAQRMADAFGAAFETLADFRGVSIAAINGFAMGGDLRWRWPAIFASLKATPRWRYRRRRSAYYPVRGGRNDWLSWWERAGPSA